MPSKPEERFFVDFWMSQCGEWLHVEREGESPDFLMSHVDGRIGLEVAQVFHDGHIDRVGGSNAKELEARRAKQLRRIAHRYYEGHRLPVRVQASIEDPERVDIPAAVAAIADCRCRTPWDRSIVVAGGAKLHICSLPRTAINFDRWVVIDNFVGWRQNLEPAHIEHLIQEKSMKLSAYRQVVERNELLLVVDTTHPSGMLDLNGAIPSINPRGFDAVHLCIYPRMVVQIS
jgi:hypothetical protein